MIKIGFIGYGRMGQALAKGAMDGRVLLRKNVGAFDTGAEAKRLIRKDRIRNFLSIADTLKFSSCIFLCVKPQQLRDVLLDVHREIKNLKNRVLFVSIAAGFPLKKLTGLLGRNVPVIRVMPNTPALLRAGMSVMSLGRGGVSSTDISFVRKILGAVGSVLLLPEAAMDAVTAVSGSGPAYVFYLAEAMMEAARTLGLSQVVAQELVKETIFGAGKMLKITNTKAAQLRAQVTSKGGTTEAAIRFMDKARLKTGIQTAIHKAAQRSKELSCL